MSENRIFGKEVSLRLTRSNALIREITAIKTIVFETRQRIITEGYLGEGAMRQDEIFDEVGGNFTAHPEGPEILLLQQMISQRAARRIANDEQVSATFRYQFTTGVIARITVPNMKFDPIPLNSPERDRYVEMTMTYKASSYILSIA
jgi:hypothetical protein